MELKIDITDWDEEFQKAKPDVSTHDQIIERAKEGIKPQELGRHTIVARENGHAPMNILKPIKTLLSVGAAYETSQIICQKMRIANLKNGKSFKVRALVGATEDVENDVLVDSDTEDGYQNSVNYLRTKAIGHISNRLTLIAEYGGPVEDLAEEVIKEIRNIVGRIT